MRGRGARRQDDGLPAPQDPAIAHGALLPGPLVLGRPRLNEYLHPAAAHFLFIAEKPAQVDGDQLGSAGIQHIQAACTSAPPQPPPIVPDSRPSRKSASASPPPGESNLSPRLAGGQRSLGPAAPPAPRFHRASGASMLSPFPGRQRKCPPVPPRITQMISATMASAIPRASPHQCPSRWAHKFDQGTLGPASLLQLLEHGQHPSPAADHPQVPRPYMEKCGEHLEVVPVSPGDHDDSAVIVHSCLGEARAKIVADHLGRVGKALAVCKSQAGHRSR